MKMLSRQLTAHVELSKRFFIFSKDLIFQRLQVKKVSNGVSMPRRRPARATTDEARHAALDAALELLEEGTEAVTVAAIAERLPGRGSPWIYAYLGNRSEILQALAQREVVRLCSQLDQITQAQMTPPRRVRAVLEVLLPRRNPRAALWVLALAPRHGLDGQLEDAVSRALSPEMGRYTEAIGIGVLAILGRQAGRNGTREEILSVISDMTMAVALFRVAATRRRKGVN